MTSAALPSGQQSAPQTVVRLSGAEDILGMLPHRLGFHPTESLVVIFLEGPRRRDRLVMRVDLVEARHEGALAADVARRMRSMRADAAVLVCYTDRPSADQRLPRAGLVRAVTRLLQKGQVEVLEALLVHEGRWFSYHCSDPGCCPGSGSPLPAELSPGAGRYAAEAVLRGGSVLPSRESLEQSIEPVAEGTSPTRARLVAEAAGRLGALVASSGVEASRDLVVAGVGRLAAAWSDGDTELEDEDVALVTLGLHDTRTRDEVMTLVLDHDPAVLVALFSEMARRTDDIGAAPVCTVLAWAAYADGSGALASIAVDRALRCQPGYRMALLVLDGLNGMVSPSTVQRISRRVRADLAAGGDGWAD